MHMRYIQNQNSFCCSMMNCHYIRYPLEYFLASMQKFGFTHIEFFGAMPNFYLDDVDDTLLARAINGCRQYGLTVNSFAPAQGAYPFSISVNEAAPRRRSIQMLKKGIEVTRKLGAGYMLVSSGFGYENEPYDTRWGLCRDALMELGEHAAHNRVVLMLEPLTPPTSNVINSSAQSARMLREVHSPYVKSMLDIGVMNYMEESVDAYFDTIGPDLVHIHFTDGPGLHVALGDGTFPMPDYAEQILRRNYRGYWSFEINDRRYLTDPDSAVEKNILWLKQNGFSD